MFLVAFHAYIAIFTAAAIIPAYVDLAMDLHKTVPQASYLTSAQVCRVALYSASFYALLGLGNVSSIITFRLIKPIRR